MACHRSRSLGAGARISRRCRSLASICHCSRNRSICLTLTTNPSPTPYRANPVPPQIYRITLRISPWLRFRTGIPRGTALSARYVPHIRQVCLVGLHTGSHSLIVLMLQTTSPSAFWTSTGPYKKADSGNTQTEAQRPTCTPRRHHAPSQGNWWGECSILPCLASPKLCKRRS